jgi:hypothetical protein
MHCSATVFFDELSNSFQHFLTFSWYLVALNVRHLQLTLDRPRNVNAIQKPLSVLNNVLQKASRSISRVSFTEFHAKLDADTLLDFAINRRQNETRSPKSTPVKTMRVHSAVSGGRLMQ